MRVLLTGATGFVGKHLYPALVGAGHEVVCASRRPERARALEPAKRWVQCDASDPDSTRRALEGCEAAYYLVHSLASGAGWPEREVRTAEVFRGAAAAQRLGRIVYLGGMAPRGAASPHLQSRLLCGEILRGGLVPTFELRAGMIIGAGSASWRMVRDLAERLPAMVLPRWMAKHSWPVASDDVVHALLGALELPAELAHHYDLPGPERISHQEVLLRVAHVMGKHPVHMRVPLVTPRLSSYWIGLVSDVDFELARILVAGLSSDLDPKPPTFWSLLPPHHRLTLEESVDRALQMESLGEPQVRAAAPGSEQRPPAPQGPAPQGPAPRGSQGRAPGSAGHGGEPPSASVP